MRSSLRLQSAEFGILFEAAEFDCVRSPKAVEFHIVQLSKAAESHIAQLSNVAAFHILQPSEAAEFHIAQLSKAADFHIAQLSEAAEFHKAHVVMPIAYQVQADEIFISHLHQPAQADMIPTCMAQPVEVADSTLSAQPTQSRGDAAVTATSTQAAESNHTAAIMAAEFPTVG